MEISVENIRRPLWGHWRVRVSFRHSDVLTLPLPLLRKPPLFPENLSLRRLLTPPGLSWGAFGRSWAPPGRSWAVFWGSCGILGRLGQVFGRSWARLGGILACLGEVLGGLGASWGGLGEVFGGSWGVLAAKTDQERGPREF